MLSTYSSCNLSYSCPTILFRAKAGSATFPRNPALIALAALRVHSESGTYLGIVEGRAAQPGGQQGSLSHRKLKGEHAMPAGSSASMMDGTFRKK